MLPPTVTKHDDNPTQRRRGRKRFATRCLVYVIFGYGALT